MNVGHITAVPTRLYSNTLTGKVSGHCLNISLTSHLVVGEERQNYSTQGYVVAHDEKDFCLSFPNTRSCLFPTLQGKFLFSTKKLIQNKLLK